MQLHCIGHDQCEADIPHQFSRLLENHCMTPLGRKPVEPWLNIRQTLPSHGWTGVRCGGRSGHVKFSQSALGRRWMLQMFCLNIICDDRLQEEEI